MAASTLWSASGNRWSSPTSRYSISGFGRFRAAIASILSEVSARDDTRPVGLRHSLGNLAGPAPVVEDDLTLERLQAKRLEHKLVPEHVPNGVIVGFEAIAGLGVILMCAHPI